MKALFMISALFFGSFTAEAANFGWGLSSNGNVGCYRVYRGYQVGKAVPAKRCDRYGRALDNYNGISCFRITPHGQAVGPAVDDQHCKKASHRRRYNYGF
jgi:hypothetical protein